MKNQSPAELTSELLELTMEQLRLVRDLQVTDRNFSSRITKADTTFNGVGKAIKIAALDALQKSVLSEGERVAATTKIDAAGSKKLTAPKK